LIPAGPGFKRYQKLKVKHLGEPIFPPLEAPAELSLGATAAAGGESPFRFGAFSLGSLGAGVADGEIPDGSTGVEQATS
jgi:hypothetical protein